MALSISLTGDWLESVGSVRATNGTITFDNSYATGGESLTPANVGLGAINFIEFNNGTSGYVFQYDYTAQKVLVYRSGSVTPAGTVAAPTFTGESYTPAGTNAAPALTMDAYTPAGTNANDGPPETFTGTQATLTGSVAAPAFTGTAHTLAGTNSAPAFTGSATTAAALAEVANGVNLSTVTVQFRATGR